MQARAANSSYFPITTERRRLQLYPAESSPSIVILKPHDIVLAEIASGLHLDQLQHDLAWIFEPVDCADRNIDRLVLVHRLNKVIDGYPCHAPHDDPVLGAVKMLLQGE